MDPTVTAMCSQCRNVRSFAKNVLGSIFIGVVRRRGLSAPMTRSNHVRCGGPLATCDGRTAGAAPAKREACLNQVAPEQARMVS